jgi:hypothetical protein
MDIETQDGDDLKTSLGDPIIQPLWPEAKNGDKDRNWLGANVPLAPRFRHFVDQNIDAKDLSKKEERPHVTLAYGNKVEDYLAMVNYAFTQPNLVRLSEIGMAMKPYYVQSKRSDIDVVCVGIRCPKWDAVTSYIVSKFTPQDSKRPPLHQTLCYCKRPKDGSYPVKIRFSELTTSDVNATTTTMDQLNQILTSLIPSGRVYLRANSIYWIGDMVGMRKWTLVPCIYEPSPKADHHIVVVLSQPTIHQIKLETKVLRPGENAPGSMYITSFEPLENGPMISVF